MPAPEPESKAQALHLLNLLPGLVAYFGVDLRYRFANETYARWRGIDPASIVGRYVREVVGERNYPVIAANLQLALRGETVTYEYHIFEHQHRRRVQGTYVPDVDASGEVVGVIVLVTDISRRDDLQLRIAESEAMFNEAFDQAPIGNAMVGADGRILRVNASLAQMLGRDAVDVVGIRLRDITHPDDISSVLALFREVLDNKRSAFCADSRYLRPDGSCVIAKLAVSAVRDDQGKLIRLFAHVEDVTQQREAERQLIVTNARLSLVTKAIRGGSWHLDIETEQFQPSEALACFVGGPGTGSLGLAAYRACIHPDDLGPADLTTLSTGQRDRMSVEYRLETYTGSHWMRCDRQLLRDENGKPEQIVGVTIDMTEEHKKRINAELQASTDPLTGLLNRRGFDQKLQELDDDCACGIMMIDLDGFKQVNDRLGHDAGDSVLAEAAIRLKSAVRSSDLVARLGGDEFAVVLVGADPDSLRGMAERAVGMLSKKYQACTDTPLRVGASLGATWAPKPPTPHSGVFLKADKALYEAKGAGRGTWRLAA